MVARRFALAVGLLLGIVFSQAPEFLQQYRQRLGGAVDELKRMLAQFDGEASAQSLTRDAGIARLSANADPLVRARGTDLQLTVDRERRLEAQERAFAQAGPVLQYWVLVDRLDPDLARQAYAIYQPAVPVTPQGFVAAGCGLLVGYGGARAAAAPFRRRRRLAVA